MFKGAFGKNRKKEKKESKWLAEFEYQMDLNVRIIEEGSCSGSYSSSHRCEMWVSSNLRF